MSCTKKQTFQHVVNSEPNFVAAVVSRILDGKTSPPLVFSQLAKVFVVFSLLVKLIIIITNVLGFLMRNWHAG